MGTPPPPDSSSLQPPGTPVHTRSTITGGSETKTKYENRSMTLSRLTDEMSPFFVGPITAQEFLDSFLPPPPTGSSVPLFKKGMFNSVTQTLHEQEVKWYSVFVSSDSCCPSILLLGLSRTK
jgi:hypothetical protein